MRHTPLRHAGHSGCLVTVWCIHLGHSWVVSAVARRVPGVAGSHRIRTRGVPGAVRVDLHIQIAPHLNIVQAHGVRHWVIDALKREIPGVHDVVVHTEPARARDSYPELPERMLPTTAPRPADVGAEAASGKRCGSALSDAQHDVGHVSIALALVAEPARLKHSEHGLVGRERVSREGLHAAFLRRLG